MKKLLFISFITLITLFIFSCKSEKEKTEVKLKAAIKSIFEEAAFKYNEKLTYFEIKSFEYREVGENVIDSSKLNKILIITDQYNEQVRNNQELAKKEYDLAVISKNFSSSVYKMHLENFEQYKNKAQNYIDSINYNLSLDSTIRVRMKNNTDVTPKYYQTKSYCNVKFGKENIMDTMIFYFNKDFTVFDLSKNLK